MILPTIAGLVPDDGPEVDGLIMRLRQLPFFNTLISLSSD